MRFALIGKDIAHSRSPAIYKKLISPNIQYDLIDVPEIRLLPPLAKLASIYQGINITSPYKRFYFSSLKIDDKDVQTLGAINTVCFSEEGWLGTNTDLIAVREILQEFQQKHSKLHLLILGSGVMSSVTVLAAQKLNLNYQVFDRQMGLTPASDLGRFYQEGAKNIIINACSRDFIFTGAIHPQTIFWDYNYAVVDHHSTLPAKVESYIDGQELLLRQAQAAAKFWRMSKY